jgi:hypothetical protein
MKLDMSKWGPMTLLVVIAALVVLLAGAAKLVFGDGLTYDEYISDITKIAGVGAVLGIGRGISNGLEKQGK